MGNRLTRAGNFTRPVTILRRVVTRNAANEEIEGAPVETDTLAWVGPAPGTERFQSGERAAEAPMRFVLRWRPDVVRVTDSIRHDGRIYAVSSVTEIGIREGLEILAVARGEST